MPRMYVCRAGSVQPLIFPTQVSPIVMNRSEACTGIDKPSKPTENVTPLVEQGIDHESASGSWKTANPEVVAAPAGTVKG